MGEGGADEGRAGRAIDELSRREPGRAARLSVQSSGCCALDLLQVGELVPWGHPTQDGRAPPRSGRRTDGKLQRQARSADAAKHDLQTQSERVDVASDVHDARYTAVDHRLDRGASCEEGAGILQAGPSIGQSVSEQQEQALRFR